MGEPHLGDIADELVGQLQIAQAHAPRAEVHLVRGHRGVVRVTRRPRGHPRVVGPLVAGRVDDGCRRGRVLRVLGQRVGLRTPDPVPAEDGELVAGAGAEVRDEQLPHAARAQRAHGVPGAVPVVGVADDSHAERGGRPHGERRAVHVAQRGCIDVLVRAEDGPQRLVTSLADEVEVHVAEGRQEAVGVVEDGGLAAVGDLEPVVGDVGNIDDADEDPAVLVRQLDAAVSRRAAHQRDDRGRPRTQRADRDGAGVGVRTEDRVGVVVASLDHALQVGGGHRCGLRPSYDRVLGVLLGLRGLLLLGDLVGLGLLRSHGGLLVGARVGRGRGCGCGLVARSGGP
jgi:hypothetical protein